MYESSAVDMIRRLIDAYDTNRKAWESRAADSDKATERDLELFDTWHELLFQPDMGPTARTIAEQE